MPSTVVLLFLVPHYLIALAEFVLGTQTYFTSGGLPWRLYGALAGLSPLALYWWWRAFGKITILPRQSGMVENLSSKISERVSRYLAKSIRGPYIFVPFGALADIRLASYGLALPIALGFFISLMGSNLYYTLVWFTAALICMAPVIFIGSSPSLRDHRDEIRHRGMKGVRRLSSKNISLIAIVGIAFPFVSLLLSMTEARRSEPIVKVDIEDLSVGTEDDFARVELSLKFTNSGAARVDVLDTMIHAYGYVGSKSAASDSWPNLNEARRLQGLRKYGQPTGMELLYVGRSLPPGAFLDPGETMNTRMVIPAAGHGEMRVLVEVLFAHGAKFAFEGLTRNGLASWVVESRGAVLSGMLGLPQRNTTVRWERVDTSDDLLPDLEFVLEPAVEDTVLAWTEAEVSLPSR